MKDNYESWGESDNPYLPSSNTITTLSSFASLRKDDELFKDEDNKVEKIFNVKKINLPNKNNNWEFFEDGKIVFTLYGNELTNSQKKFLYSPTGMIFLLNSFKNGARNVDALKKLLHERMNNT